MMDIFLNVVQAISDSRGFYLSILLIIGLGMLTWLLIDIARDVKVDILVEEEEVRRRILEIYKKYLVS